MKTVLGIYQVEFKMKFAFVIIKAYSFGGGYTMEEAHLDRETAETAADEMNAKTPLEDKPVYDDYGLVEGYEFVVIAVDLK